MGGAARLFSAAASEGGEGDLRPLRHPIFAGGQARPSSASPAFAHVGVAAGGGAPPPAGSGIAGGWGQLGMRLRHSFVDLTLQGAWSSPCTWRNGLLSKLIIISTFSAKMVLLEFPTFKVSPFV